MGKATPRDIAKSVRDHDMQQADQRDRAPQRHQGRGLSSYTSDSPKKPAGVPGAFGRTMPEGWRGRELKDARDRYWVSLCKQVMAGARITVR